MRLKRIAKGVYQAESGAFYVRPLVAGVRTLRKLAARSPAAACMEAQSMTFKLKHPFADLAKTWLEGGCPDGNGRPREADYIDRATKSLKMPVEYFGQDDIHTLGTKKIAQYGAWRAGKVKKAGKTGARVADLELAYCASLFNWAKRLEITSNDPFAGRTRFQRASEIKHSTERAPQSADEVHAIGRALLNNPRSRSSGFLWMFLALTGCRCGEMRQLRLDAKPNGVAKPAGYFSPNEIVVLRGKQHQAGEKRNPYGVIPLNDAGKDLLRAWKVWHDEEARWSPYWFPGRNKSTSLSNGALTRQLAKVCKRLGIPVVTAHGARSFWTTVFRQQESDDRIVAARLGHANPAMVQQIYGDRMSEHRPELTWLPSNGDPAWKLPIWEGKDAPDMSPNPVRPPIEI